MLSLGLNLCLFECQTQQMCVYSSIPAIEVHVELLAKNKINVAGVKEG